jgi:hypothetical protein
MLVTDLEHSIASMRCFQALRGHPHSDEGFLAFREGDIIIHIPEVEANGLHMGVCNGSVGYYCPDDVTFTELPALVDDVTVFLDVQRSLLGRRDSTASVISASSSAATVATVKTGFRPSVDPRPSLGDAIGELASILHAVRGYDFDTDVRSSLLLIIFVAREAATSVVIPIAADISFSYTHISSRHQLIWLHHRLLQNCRGTPRAPVLATLLICLLLQISPPLILAFLMTILRKLLSVACRHLPQLTQRLSRIASATIHHRPFLIHQPPPRIPNRRHLSFIPESSRWCFRP